jgi:hypothetical protein
MSDLPDRAPDGQFTNYQQWVNKARSWIGDTNALVADAKGRICRIGLDMMRARDEGAFPVRFWFDEGHRAKPPKPRKRRMQDKPDA